jgi:hypothetical protein
MTAEDAQQDLEHALGRIESAILPTLSLMLDSLLDAASLARPGHDAESYAADLRALASELETLTCAVEGMTHRQHFPPGPCYRGASAA